MTCMKIQWSKVHTINGEPCCPECGKPAEMILGLFANPRWAHKIEEEQKCNTKKDNTKQIA